MTVHDSVLELIGNTPMVKAQRLDTGPCELFLKLENRNQALASQTADAAEARSAWFEKRDPQWRDS